MDFAEPTLLLLGTSSSFNWLAEQVERRREMVLEGAAGRALGILLLVPSAQEGRFSRHGHTLTWRISLDQAARVTQQLRELAASLLPAHVYLDPENNFTDLQVVASKGEYDPARVFGE